MKKIYSFALAAVALFSAASCQKELVDNNFENQGGDFTVTAVASVESKTVLVDGVKTYWTPGDKISVFNAEGKSVAFSTNITANAASAKFTNTAAFDAPATLYAAYPDREGNQTLADGIIKNFRIAGTQAVIAGSFDPTFGSAVGIEGADGKLDYKQSAVFSHTLYSDYYWYEIGDVIGIGNTDVLYYCFPKTDRDVVAKARLATEELYRMALIQKQSESKR